MTTFAQVTMIPCRCYSDECKKSGSTSQVQYVDSRTRKIERCPFCNNPGTLYPLETIHLIAEDPTGPISGTAPWSDPSTHYQFLCESSRTGFIAGPGSPFYPKHFTIVPNSATCLNCLTAFGKKLQGTVLTGD